MVGGWPAGYRDEHADSQLCVVGKPQRRRIGLESSARGNLRRAVAVSGHRHVGGRVDLAAAQVHGNPDLSYDQRVLAESVADMQPAALRHRQTYQLARLAAVVRGLCAKHLASAGLRQHQHAILCCLAEFGPECQSDIAARLGIDSGDMVAFVDDLERAGLVSRRRDERDRRRQILILAPAGSRVLRQAEMLLDQGTATIFAPLDTSETDELRRLMLRVLAHHEPGAWP